MRRVPVVVSLSRLLLGLTLGFALTPREAVAARFEPVFLAVHAREPIRPMGVKWEHPIYNLTGWKRADGRVVHDVFELGDVILLDRPVVTRTTHTTRWTFTHEALDLEAEVTGGQLRFEFTTKKPGQWTVAYAGAPAAPLEDVVELFQPLIWNGRRLPEASFLIPDDICSIPGCLVQNTRGTVGVMADPRQFPFEMPNGRNRRFGVTVRNREGLAQPLVFAPFPGSLEASLAAGESRSYELVLVDDARPLAVTFEAVAREVCGFRDRRENTLVSLNRALENIVDFATSPAGRFDSPNRAYSYPDSAGTVKNVSALHPLTLAIVTDDERLFRDQGIPLLEYLLSREKFLFALSDDTKGSQTPSRRLAGPAMPVSELAALHWLTHGANPYLLACAERLSRVDRTLNMEWVSPADSWQSDLWLYRATREPARLNAARTKAGEAIAARIDRQPTDFVEAGTGTFFDYMLPPWKDLYELWLDTRDPRHLAAAHKAARQYAQMVWFYPAVPDGDVVVNESGFAPRRARPGEPGLVPAPREQVPAWRVSEQGLICEGNGTVGRLAIYLATHAPLFMRLSHDAADPFLRDIARSAIVGRFAGFPGYHFNTTYSTAQEKTDFALRPFDEIRHTTSMHFNHSLPMAALVLDYLFSDAYARSRGAIEFPAEYAEGYAYLGGRVYGQSGRFHDQENVRPWMPKGLVTTDSVQVNYVAGRGEETLCIALMNQCGRPLDDVTVQIDRARIAEPSGAVVAEVWQEGVKKRVTVPVEDGQLHVAISPHGLTALVIKGLEPMPTLQQKLRSPAEGIRGTNDVSVAMPCGSARALRLSFGEQLTWVYAYVECRASDVRNVRLAVDHDGTVTRFTDDTYPFEFSVPDIGRDQPVKVQFEVEGAGGAVHRSEFVSVAASESLLDRAVVNAGRKVHRAAW
jgi:hypothetical protein